MRRRPNHQGATLIELMTYMLLLGLLMTGVYSAFYISRTYYDSAQGTTAAQQEAMKAINGVAAALSDSKGGSLAPNPSPAGIVLLSAHPSYLSSQLNFAHDIASGQVMWQQWVMIYLDSSRQELIRKSVAYSAPQLAPATMTAASIYTATGSNVSTRVLARNISLFDPVLSPSPSPMAGTLNITVASLVQSQRFGANQVNVTSQINIRQ